MPIGLRSPRVFDPALGTTVADEGLTQEESTDLTLPQTSNMERGFRSSMSGLSADALANEANKAEIAGDAPRAAQLRTEMNNERARQSQFLPAVTSAEQITGPGTALDFAAGAVGQAIPTMGPPLAGAALGRFALRSPLLAPAARTAAGDVGAHVGAGLPAYAMERNEQLGTQFNDPVQAALDPQLRRDVAAGKGLVNAALESLVPASLTKLPVGKSVAGQFGKTIGTEALTEGLQTATGQQAQSFLNPERDTSGDVQEIVDAALAGGIAGGAVGLPHAATAGLAEFADRSIEAARESGGNVQDYVRRAFPSRETDPETLAAKSLELGDGDPSLFSEDPMEFGRRLGKAAGDRARDAKAFAERILKDTGTSDKIKAQVASFKDKYDDPEVQAFIGKHINAANAAKVAASAVDRFEQGWDKVKAVAKGAVEGATKASRMTPEGDYQSTLQVITSNLRDDIELSTETTERLRTAARRISARLADFEQLDRASLKALAELGDLFTDPDAAFRDLATVIGSDKFLGALKSVSSARFDARIEDSVLRRNLAPEAQEYFAQNPEAAIELGRVVDQLIQEGLGKNEASAIRNLEQAFGGPAGLRDVLDYYQEAHGKRIGKDRVQYSDESAPRLATPDDESIIRDPDAEEVRLTTKEAPDASYHFKSVGAQNEPFDSLEEAQGALRQGKRGRIVSVGDMAGAVGADKARMAKSLRDRTQAAAANRVKQGAPEELAKRLAAVESAATPEERAAAQKRVDYSRDLVSPNARAKTRSMMERALKLEKLSDDEVLGEFMVIEDDGSMSESMDLNDREFKQMRKLVEAKRLPKSDPKAKKVDAERKATLMTVVLQDKEIQMSAESIWKTWSEKMSKEQAFRDETQPAFIARMFKEGFAALVMRPEVAVLPTLTDDLLIDRASGLTWGGAKKLQLENPAVNTQEIGESAEVKPDSGGIEKRRSKRKVNPETGTLDQIDTDTDKFGPLWRKKDTGSVDIDLEEQAREVENLKRGEELLSPQNLRERELRKDKLDKAGTRNEAPARETKLAEAKEVVKTKDVRTLKQQFQTLKDRPKAGATSIGARNRLLQAIQDGWNSGKAEAARMKALKLAAKLTAGVATVTSEEIGDSKNAAQVGVAQDDSEAIIMMGAPKVVLANGFGFEEAALHEVAHIAVSVVYAKHGLETARQMVQLAQQEHIREQVLRHLENEKGMGDAGLAYYALSPEEMFSQAFAMWSQGKLKLNKSDGILADVFKYMKELFQAITGDEALDQVFQGIMRGELTEQGLTKKDIVAAIIDRSYRAEFLLYQVTEMNDAELEKVKNVAPRPFHKIIDKMKGAKLSGMSVQGVLANYDELRHMASDEDIIAEAQYADKQASMVAGINTEDYARDMEASRMAILAREFKSDETWQLLNNHPELGNADPLDLLFGDQATTKKVRSVLERLFRAAAYALDHDRAPETKREAMAMDLVANYRQFPDQWTASTEGKTKVDVQKALDANPHSADIVKFVSDRGGVMVGSLALAAEGDVYRANAVQIHDLDFVFKNKGGRDKAMEDFKQAFPGSAPLYEFGNVEGDSLKALLVPPAGYTVTIQRRGAGMPEGYQIKDKKGFIVGEVRKYGQADEIRKGIPAVPVDFFTVRHKRGIKEKTYKIRGKDVSVAYQEPETILRKKAGYSRTKDLNDISLYRKDLFMNAMNPGGEKLTPEQQQAVIDEIQRLRGPDINVAFANMLGGSGSYDHAKRLITISLKVGGAMFDVARHEALHDFFALVNKSDPLDRKTWDRVRNALSKPYVMNQLKALLKDHPGAWEDAQNDPEEAAAFAYQFWASGQLKLGPDTAAWFRRVQEFFRDVLGIMSEQDKVEALLGAFHEGKFANPSVAGAVLRDLQLETLRDKIERIAPPVAEFGEKLLVGATDRLRDTGIPALKALANQFHQDAGFEGKGQAFLPAVAQERSKAMNKLARIVRGANKEETALALESLQKGEPKGRIANEVRALLDDLRIYMVDAGVKQGRLSPLDKRDKSKGNKLEWVPLGEQKNYFPRAWEPSRVRANKDEFVKLMMSEGNMDIAEALAVFRAIAYSDGQVELGENEHHVGFTPFAQAVQGRRLEFINSTNHDKFSKFFEKDMMHIMTTYIQQAVHRAEYARRFGNAGEKIQDAMKLAKSQGASEKEIEEANKTVRALEGTLNHKFAPELRRLFNTLTTYQNVVLLPFALVNSLVDPMGVALRSGDWKDAWKAMHEGFSGLGKAIVGKEQDEKRQLAEDIGIVDNTLQLAVLGDIYQGPFMSKWLKNVNEKFFRWNGMSIWNDRMRIAAMAAGERFIIRHAEKARAGDDTSVRYLKELGLTFDDVIVVNDGLILSADQAEDVFHIMTGITREMGDMRGSALEHAEKMHQALFRFVDGAVLRPNAAHRPVWGSDPMWQLVFHLKQFTFSFQNTILRRANHELDHGNIAPWAMLATYVPISMATTTMKAAMLGRPIGDAMDIFHRGVSASGIAGTGQFANDAWMDAAAGSVPGKSFAGPTAGHATELANTLAGAPGHDIGRALERSVPLSPLVKAAT